LESSLLTYFRRDVPRWMYKSYNESKHLVTRNNGSTIKFGYCRNESDVYQGVEFLFIGIDELTHFTLKQWQFLISRNRCPAQVYSDGKNAGKRIVPCMAGATTRLPRPIKLPARFITSASKPKQKRLFAP
jgi:Terminase large subunit, T4likevirus-type, N-terminal